MKYKFGTRSLKTLATCDPALQTIAHIGMSFQIVDFGMIWGWRNEDQQNALYNQTPKATTKTWPNSKHNSYLIENGVMVPNSQAFDFAIYHEGKIQWKDTHAFAMMVGVFHVAARMVNRRIRSGMDWDMDGMTTDQSFMDFGHIELVPEDG